MKIPPGRLTQWKMICIKDLVDSKIFKLPLCRGILLPIFCMQIKDKLESKEEVRFISNIKLSMNGQIQRILERFLNL
jgi:dedicator of cytokinesis protein 1